MLELHAAYNKPMEHRDHCERCDKPLNDQDEAYICYYECTWCGPCAVSFNYICPNCGGELVRRPRPIKKTSNSG